MFWKKFQELDEGGRKECYCLCPACADHLPATSHLGAGGIQKSRPGLWKEIEEAMIQNYTVIWDTSKTLLISKFLYWLQVFGYLTIWSCLKKTPQDLKCVVLKHRCPKVPLLCPHVLSVALVSSPLLPDQFRLSHLRKCNWCKIAPQQMWLTFPTLVPPADSQHSMRGGMD